MAQLILKVNTDTKEAVAGINQLKQQITTMLAEIGKVPINNDLTKQMNAYAKAINATAKATKASIDATKANTQAEKLRLDQYKATTAAYKTGAEVQQKHNELIIKSTQEEHRHEEAMRKTEVQSEKLAQTTKKTSEQTKKSAQEAKNSTTEYKKYSRSILELAQSFLEYQIAASLIMKPIYKLREAFQSVNETLQKTEDAVIEIRRVLNEDIGAGEIANELYDIAINYGQQIENVWEIAQNFAKSGLSWTETLEATESAVLALNVAELTAEESSQGLIAIMAQYGYAATDLEYIIDVLNKTADNAPVTTQKLLLALQKTGSYAKAANLDLEQTVALITAISGATGVSGQQLGTAMKSLLAYTTKGKALDMYAALSPDMSSLVEEYRKGAVSILDVWGQLSNELKHLTKEQGDLLAEYAESAEGQTLEQELGEELGEIYDSMTGVYDTAGTYRKNYFIALMNNFDAVEEALETISDVEGYSQKENLQYMDTYTAKVNTLKAEWEKLANDEQGWLEFKKGLVETATVLLQILDLFGGLRTGALALLSVVTLLFGKKIFMQIKESVADLKNMLNVVKNLTTATKTQTAATEADTAAKEANAAATEAAAAAANVYLAIIIAAIAAISAIVGLVDKFKQEQEKLRGETINLWKEHQQAATTLVQLNNALEQAEKNTSAYADAESNLAKQLGITKGKINENTAAYDDYIDKIKEASREKYKEYAIEASASAGAQKKQAENQETYFFKAADMTTEDQTALQALGLGYGYANALQQYTGVGSYAVGGNAFSQYSKVSKMVDYLYEKGATNTEFYGELVNLKKSLKAQIEDYLQAAAEADIFKMLSEGTSIAAAEPEAIHLLNSLGVKDYSWKDYVADIYRQYMTSATSSTSGAGGINDEEPPELMSEEERNKQILSLLKDIRNAADTIADIEEKRKALEDAERNLTARVYNADTGRFEPRANNKNVESAKDALNNALEKAAEKEIYDKISSGNFAFGELYAIVAKYRKMGVEKNPAWASSLYSQLETVENQAYNDAYYDDYWARWEEHVKSTPTGGGVGGSVVVPESVGGDYTDNSVSVGGIVVERSPREIAELKELLGIAATISEN